MENKFLGCYLLSTLEYSAKEQEVHSTAHKAYFPITQIYSPTNLWLSSFCFIFVTKYIYTYTVHVKFVKYNVDI
jgi:hypothetical protein